MATSRKRTSYKNSLRRAFIAGLVPIAALIVDFMLSPVWIDTRIESGSASLSDILKSEVVELGVFRGHHILVSIDDMADPRYLDQLARGSTALVVSSFIDEDAGQPAVFGTLGRAVLHKLQDLSPEDYGHLMQLPETLRGSKAGQVVDLKLNISNQLKEKFPIDHLLIVTLPYGEKMEESLNKGIKNSISDLNDQGVSNIIIPLIGMKFENSKGSSDTTLTDFFDRFFSSIPATGHPDRIYVSLYKAWPSFQLESASAALNAAWRSTAVEEAKALPIHNRQSRLAEAFLLLCLISCGFFVKLTVKNILIISISFLSLGLASAGFVDFISADQDAETKLYFQIAVLIVLSVGFPFFVRWDPKDVFKGKSGKS
jgi:hypothetical protein